MLGVVGESESNRTLARAAAIIDAVGDGARSAAAIARQTDLSVSTAHRLAVAMAEYGFLRRDDDGIFTEGWRLTATAVVDAADSPLRELRDLTGETGQLWVRRGEFRVCVVSAETRQELRAIQPVGSRLPLRDGGSASRTLAPSEADRAELADWAGIESIGLRVSGLASFSVPVIVGGRTVAAVCLVLPAARMGPGPRAVHGSAVIRCARLIAEDIEARKR